MMAAANILLDAPGEGLVVDPQSWFSSPGPFELEIGCGKGGFLLSRARANPDIRILGLEIRNKHCRYCTDRLARWQIENARVMRMEARAFVMHHLPARCISVMHLYHPDPWPKKRHHKRRLVQPDFVESAVRALLPGGRWLVQSDHAEYFREMEALLRANPELQSLPWENAEADPGQDWRGTNFEIKFSGRGFPILRAAFWRAPQA